MSAWSAPFPVDLSRVRPKDEDYWDAFGAAPKAFVSRATGRRLWGSRFGEMTSLRIAAVPGRELASAAADFERHLLGKINAARVGMVFQPVKAQGLRAGAGATQDFSMLFIGFSMFLIVSAALLVGLLFRLGVEQRTQEMGLLLATGFTVAAVRRRLLGEGAVLAQDCIRKVECLEYPEIGMEAVWKIDVVDFPAFIVVDDKGNDFFSPFMRPQR